MLKNINQETDERRTLWFLVKNKHAPSFRHRLQSAFPVFKDAGFRCEILEKNGNMLQILSDFRKRDSRAFLIISKALFTPDQCNLIRNSVYKIIYDIDDAVYLLKPRRIGFPPTKPERQHRKFIATCEIVDLVTTGNSSLAKYCTRYARRVQLLPTPIDITTYDSLSKLKTSGIRLVWIGLPENLMYLQLIRPVLARIAKAFPTVCLRIVCSEFPNWLEIPIERVVWSEEVEAKSLCSSDIGIMPLSDDEWCRNKCAFKILQYMAARLPCVASPVGVNSSVVLEGITGYLPRNQKEWFSTLSILLSSSEKRKAMGELAYQKVIENHQRKDVHTKMLNLYNSFI